MCGPPAQPGLRSAMMPACNVIERRAPAPHMLQGPGPLLRILRGALAYHTNAIGQGYGGWPKVREVVGS